MPLKLINFIIVVNNGLQLIAQIQTSRFSSTPRCSLLKWPLSLQQATSSYTYFWHRICQSPWTSGSCSDQEGMYHCVTGRIATGDHWITRSALLTTTFWPIWCWLPYCSMWWPLLSSSNIFDTFCIVCFLQTGVFLVGAAKRQVWLIHKPHQEWVQEDSKSLIWFCYTWGNCIFHSLIL